LLLITPMFIDWPPESPDNQYLIAPVVAVIKQQGMWYYRGGCLSLSGSGKTQVPEMRRPHLLIH
ncbi:hypothetical protein, partial [Escherichia coli]|uniref:hypothetical protein n=1 Tax=Escherichia coli TaxID=562 RepID=UPI001BC84185